MSRASPTWSLLQRIRCGGGGGFKYVVKIKSQPASPKFKKCDRPASSKGSTFKTCGQTSSLNEEAGFKIFDQPGSPNEAGSHNEGAHLRL